MITLVCFIDQYGPRGTEGVGCGTADTDRLHKLSHVPVFDQRQSETGERGVCVHECMRVCVCV